MAKDPAFLFYPGDWSGGTMTMSRHLKGCYIDLLVAQFNSGALSLEEIKIVLGNDFAAWGALSKKFAVDDTGKYFNERLESEKSKRKEFSLKQTDRINKRWNKPGNDSGNTTVLPKIENENENKDLDLNLESVKEKKEVFGLSKNVKLTNLEFQRLEIDLGNQLLGECIEFLSSYRAEKGYKSKEDNLSIRRWVITAVAEAKQKIQKINGNGEKLSKNQSIRNSAEEAKRLIREDIASANEQREDSN